MSSYMTFKDMIKSKQIGHYSFGGKTEKEVTVTD